MKTLSTNTRNKKTQEGRPRKHRVALLLLAVLMCAILCSVLVACAQTRVKALDGEALRIHSFAELEVTEITVLNGTEAADIALPPLLKAYVLAETTQPQVETETDSAETLVTIETVEAQSADQPEVLEEIEVPVTWNCEAYDSETAGTYIFVSQLMENYTYEGEMPQVAVVVRAAEEEGQTDGTTTPEPTATPDGSVSMDDAALTTPEVTGLVPEAYQITAFTNEPIAIEVPRGTAIENIPLPATLPAINVLGEQVEVPVTWVNLSEPTNEYEYNPADYVSASVHGYGPWLFTAQLAAPEIIATEATDGATEGAEAATPAPTYAYSYTGEPVSASVSIPDCMTIDNIAGCSSDELLFRFVIFEGKSLKLPSTISAFMTDGGYKNIPVSWSGDYDRNTAGTYSISMHIGDGYSGGGRITGEVVVIRQYN